MTFSKFFSHLQEAPWYRQFLEPVIIEVYNNSILLDIGTGPGKLLEILSNEKNVSCTGTDTSSDMLQEAKEKLKNTNTELHLIHPGEALPFEQNSFNFVTICSVLFLINKEDIDILLNNSLQLLQKEGKIIILTPTGEGGILKLTKQFFSLKNRSVFIWYRVTKKRARQWTDKKYLSEYAMKHNLNYKRELVMNGFAQLEIITKLSFP
jgi:ubiquinone/menaquinone biosynthesis C-methylase UbiE